MKIFDYLYYRTYGIYLKKNESSPWIYATNLVSLIQFLNLLVLFIIVNKFVIITSDLKFFVIILYLLLFGFGLAINYFRFQQMGLFCLILGHLCPMVMMVKTIFLQQNYHIVKIKIMV